MESIYRRFLKTGKRYYRNFAKKLPGNLADIFYCCGTVKRFKLRMIMLADVRTFIFGNIFCGVTGTGFDSTVWILYSIYTCEFGKKSGTSFWQLKQLSKWMFKWQTFKICTINCTYPRSKKRESDLQFKVWNAIRRVLNQFSIFARSSTVDSTY